MMPLISEIDYGTPAAKSEKAVSLTIDGSRVSVPEGTSTGRGRRASGWAARPWIPPPPPPPSVPRSLLA
jgi:hypothetical protein